jgi:hypothetical protein
MELFFLEVDTPFISLASTAAHAGGPCLLRTEKDIPNPAANL